MKQMFNNGIVAALSALVSFVAVAADYYVASDGTYDGIPDGATTYTAIDDAINAATSASDNIYVEAGTYSTTTEWGPNLKARLVGMGATRGEVVIQSAGTYRTLRMAANSRLENVTVVGEGTNKADKGGAIEMSGGTITNCVIRDGTAKNDNANTEGGNLYISGSSLVVDCVISGGHATKRGGNVYLDAGTVRDCTITGGVCDNTGGNVYAWGGTIVNCSISGGTAVSHGGNVRQHGAVTITDSTISDGVITTGNDAKGANVFIDNNSGKLSRCHLSGGSTQNGYNGGSLQISGSSIVVEDCLIESSACGGVLISATATLYSCTIVNNEKYGVWSWGSTKHLYSTIIYGNTNNGSISEWNGDLPGSSSIVTNNATSAESRLKPTSYPSIVVIDDLAFVDYENGDYSPALGGALIDAGVSDPRGAAASATDLAGNPRTSGTIDIGCYEYQKLDMTVRIEGATYSQAFAPSTVTFAHVVENSADPSHVSFVYDFGDGSETASTTESTISHAYANPGVYTVTITATNDCEEESAQMTYAGYVRVASSIVYVTPGNTSGQAFPYDTPETGRASLRTAVQEALDGYTLLLGEGVHESDEQISTTKAITIRGLGATPETVIVRNTDLTASSYYNRTLELNANGRIENISIENGQVKDNNGGCLRLVAGIASNCVIRGGFAVVGVGNAAGAGVELGGGATLTHCVVSNNAVQGTSLNQGLAGGAVFVAYNAKNVRISNCLIAYNTYETSEGDAKNGAAGIRFGGGNDNSTIENCTIVANTVEGSLADDSAGVHCTTWHGKLRNNIIVGNYETGKGKTTSAKLDFSSGSNFIYHNNATDDVQIQDSGNKSKGNILVDSALSVFSDFAGGDFQIEPGSPAYNKGTTSGLALLPSVDLVGKPRVFGRAIDIGCYECQRKPGVALILR